LKSFASIICFLLLSNCKLSAQTEAERFAVDTTTYRNESTVATSEDGQIVLTYKDNKGSAELYISRLIGNKWTEPEKLDKPLNTKGWELNQFISADGNTLFFTSNRAGGFGGKDIYVSKKLSDGEWGKAMNLGSVINSPYDEEAPFIYSDGVTLFFSSNKYKQTCCFDNFSSTLSIDGNLKPTKIGYPEKTEADALFYATTMLQPDSIAGNNDWYLATFIDINGIPFAVLKGKVEDINGKVVECVTITVTDNEKRKVAAIYNSNYKTGNYLFTLPTETNIAVNYEAEGYSVQSENINISNKNDYFELRKVIQLLPVIAEEKGKYPKRKAAQ